MQSCAYFFISLPAPFSNIAHSVGDGASTSLHLTGAILSTENRICIWIQEDRKMKQRSPANGMRGARDDRPQLGLRQDIGHIDGGNISFDRGDARRLQRVTEASEKAGNEGPPTILR